MKRQRRILALLVFAILLPIPGDSTDAYYQFRIGSASLSWSSGSLPVTFVLQSTGSDNISDDAEFLAIRQAFQVWEDLADSSIAFNEDLTADDTRTDYAATDIHLVMFDEDDSTGLFPGASGTLAVTPVLFNTSTGQILDADIIFNGDDHTFSVDGASGTYDVQSIGTHEIGHLLGLDHSTSCAATMYPFAEPGRTVARSLTADDTAGAESIYSSSGTVGALTGTVVRSGSGATVTGAHVVAINDDGVVIATTYSASDGTFTLARLPIDVYSVYAEPLDGPVAGSNLSSSIGSSPTTDFETTYWGGNGSPSSTLTSDGVTQSIGTISVGAAISANLSITGDSPYTAIRGTSTTLMALGSSIGISDTVTISGSGVTVDSTSFLNLGAITGYLIDISIASNAVLGPRNIRIDTTGSELTVLTGAVEIAEARPTLSSISPTSGLSVGGTALTLTGTNLLAGATVTIGGALATSVTVGSSTQITATSPLSDPGTYDVTVQNPDGEIAVLTNAFVVASQPVLTALFPTSGTTAGGTSVILIGTQFLVGSTITFGGHPATVDSINATSIVVTTPAVAAGTVDVVVTSGALSSTLSNSYTFVATPDPVVTSVTPSSGTTAGGEVVTITGTDFDPAAIVTFGQSVSGSGGSLASNVVVVSSTEIQATTPAGSAALVAVTVQNPVGSASRLAAAFTYVAPAAGGGGGGGGCFALPPASLSSGPDIGGTMFPWMLLALILVAIKEHARRQRRVR